MGARASRPRRLDGLAERLAEARRLVRAGERFFGTRGDVGGQADLEVAKATPRRLSIATLRVDTTLIHGADHMSTGERPRSRVVDGWVRRAVPADR